MSPSTKNALLLAGFALAAIALVVLLRLTQHPVARPLDAAPADSFLVVSADVDALRESVLGQSLLLGPGGKLLDGGAVAEACGFDPIERVREVAVAVPVEDQSGEFGIAVKADLSKDELMECAKKFGDRSGTATRLSFVQSGTYTLAEPQGELAKKYPTLAYRDGGPILIAHHPFIDKMILTVDKKAPSVRAPSVHLDLMQALNPPAPKAPPKGPAPKDAPPGGARPALVATVFLPKEMRERIRRDMAHEAAEGRGDRDRPPRGEPQKEPQKDPQADPQAEPQEAPAPAPRRDGAREALMEGVLGVRAAGLAVSPGTEKAGVFDLRLVVFCESAEDCDAVDRLIDQTRHKRSIETVVGLLGMGPLLENLKVEPQKDRLFVSTFAPSDLAGRWVDRALMLRGGRLAQDAGP